MSDVIPRYDLEYVSIDGEARHMVRSDEGDWMRARDVLAPRDPSPELAEAEKWLRDDWGCPCYGQEMSDIIVAELDRLRASERRLEAEVADKHKSLTVACQKLYGEPIIPAPAHDRATPLPCPWCGKLPMISIGLGHHFVGCMTDDCPAQPVVAATGDQDSADNTDEVAIRRWNTRVTAERAGKDGTGT